MAHPRIVQLVALLVCGGLIYGAARLTPAINAGRKQLNMYGDDDVLVNAPPEYAFWIQGFGAFRSLIVNFAFIRAETYKEQARYHDAMQLASWICMLQPRFPSVWEFQAWNMAWNISVTTFTAQERWNWVYNGVKLLRDDGIRYNPGAVNLYKQLAWIFNNKMSETMDDFHWDYKRAWAWRMHLVLGPHPSALGGFRPDEEFEPVVFDVGDDPLLEAARISAEQSEEDRRRRREEEGVPFRTSKPLEERLAQIPLDEPAEPGLTPAEVAKRAAYDYIKAIADAPVSLEELFEEYPEARQMVAQLRAIDVVITDDPLDEGTYWYEGKLASTFFARYRKLLDTPRPRAADAPEPAGAADAADDAVERLDEIVGVREGRPAGQALVRFLQRKVLTEVYKLKPERMAYLVENFGPVDWRVVDAHSLYWVAEGLERGGEMLNTFQNDKTNTARILFFSLRNLCFRNRISFEPNPDDVFRSYINFAPDLDFIEPMHRAYITYGPMIDPDPGDASGAGDMFRTGHVNFLSDGIRRLYFSDRVQEAEHYYEYLRTHYGRKRHDDSVDERYTQPLHDFVMETFYGDVDSPRETEGVIADLLYRAYNELSREDVNSYNRLVAKARQFHQRYTSERGNEAGPRMKLRAFQDYQIDVFGRWFMLPTTNENEMIRKTHLWLVAGPRLRQWVYDALREGFRRECALWGLDVAKAFPEPPGMAEFRAQHRRREAERRAPTAETPAQPSGG